VCHNNVTGNKNKVTSIVNSLTKLSVNVLHFNV
jgi:hypothetical protein